MNAEAEREFFLRSSELMGKVGPSGFMVLAYLFRVAERVDGQLVVNTTCRRSGIALGLSPTTASRKFEMLRCHGLIAGDVSPQGCRFTLPESAFDETLSGGRRANQAA